MHDFHEHLSKQLRQHLTKRGVVVWYDYRGEFVDYIAELSHDKLPDSCRLDAVAVDGSKATLCVTQGSLYEAKFLVEPLVSGDQPSPLLVYVPGQVADAQISPLAELELGGTSWEPQLKREARRVLKSLYGDGQIDQMLQSENVAYADIVGLLAAEPGGGQQPRAMLNVIFSEARNDNASILADWLANDNRDAEIAGKGADVELRQLIASRLGLELQSDVTLPEARRRTSRYVLIGEFRSDLEGDAPAVLQMVPGATTKDERAMLADVAHKYRRRHADAYAVTADAIQAEFDLPSQGIAPARLGNIDTFRFEDELLLDYAAELVAGGQFQKAVEIVAKRRKNFWAEHDILRQEQWRVHELMAQLGEAVDITLKQLPSTAQKVGDWFQRYTANDGWHRVDQLHRRLESTYAMMSQEVAAEQALARVRNDYHELLGKMTRGFVTAFKESGWTISGTLHQSQIHAKHAAGPGEVVAWFLVDALRYEMGVELAKQLDGAGELNLTPAVASLPTITPVGMAALLPGADQTFSVVTQGSTLAVRVADNIVTDLASRRKVWKGSIPGLVDLELDKVLSLKPSELRGRVEGAAAVVVRSLEIDAMGEGGNTLLARQIIDTAIGNITRAVRRMAGLGVTRFVITADHGHLFTEPRDESQRMDSPGGETIELHRRCWIGRGGATPAGSVRISGSQLGYDSDLDFVFPTGDGVFKAGGDLCYYHGGLSLQELVVPVLTVKMPTVVKDQGPQIEITLANVPERIAHRLVRVDLNTRQDLFDEATITVQVVLVSKGAQVGHAIIALDGVLDSVKHHVSFNPGKTCSVGLQLLRDDIDTLQIVVLDPTTDRVLVQSKNLPVKLGL